MMQKQFSVGPLSGPLKPKYRLIDILINEPLNDGSVFNPEKGVDVFIDLNTLLKTISSSRKAIQSIPFSKNVDREIVSSILYIIKHWKDYTRKYEDCKIYLILNDIHMENIVESKQLKSYLYPYINKFEKDVYGQLVYYWDESIKTVETVLKYIPNVYLINCKTFDSYVIPNVINDYETNNRYRLIITGNSLFTSYQYMKNCKVLFSAWSTNGITQMTEANSIIRKITKIDDSLMESFNKRVLFNLLNIIIGDFERGILGLNQLGITRFATDLTRSIEQNKIPSNPQSIESILQIMDKTTHEYILKSYPLVDIDQHSQMIPQSQIEKIKSNMIDLVDIDGLRSINIDGLNLLELL